MDWRYTEIDTLKVCFKSENDFNGNAVKFRDWLFEKHLDYNYSAGVMEIYIPVSEIDKKDVVDDLISCSKLAFLYDEYCEYEFDFVKFEKSHLYMQASRLDRIARKVCLAYTKKDLLGFLKYKLGTDDKWALRALQRIYEGQTVEELNEESTQELYGLGFTGFDAPILTSIYKSYLEHGKRLTPKQLNVVKKMMGKYAGQIYRSPYMNKTQLEKVYAKYLEHNLF